MTSDSRSGFPHERLDAYHVALELIEATTALTKELPRGYADLRDQANRSALSTVRHIAEGASRISHADKRARFIVARGEVAELHATLDSAKACGLLEASHVEPIQRLADRVGAMLAGLVRREARHLPGK